jgi:hypothetical protein
MRLPVVDPLTRVLLVEVVEGFPSEKMACAPGLAEVNDDGLALEVIECRVSAGSEDQEGRLVQREESLNLHLLLLDCRLLRLQDQSVLNDRQGVLRLVPPFVAS